MGLALAQAALDFRRRRWRWLILAAAAGASGYCAYHVYSLPALVEKRRRMAKLLGAFSSLAKAVSASAETVAIVSEDLNGFLRSDSDEVPSTVRQISKIARSDEVAASVSRISEALTIREGGGVELPERILDKLFSTAGSGFASVVVGSFARNMVMAFYSPQNQASTATASIVPEWVNLIYGDEFQQLIGNCIQLFVSTAVAVYLDKTIHINTYDELFSVRDLLISVCNGAIETLVKTSHQVMSGSSPGPASSSWTDREEDTEAEVETPPMMHIRRRSFDLSVKDGGHGWVEKVSSTLSIPSNRSLVLDLTGRVTSETLLDAANHGAKIVRGEIVEKGLDAMRYVLAKSMIIFALCLALCLHLFSGTGFLVPTTSLDLSQTSNPL
ncbi:unnamed protein product [Spirodela intermedia]|uniref:Uncharacterized protein n=1 Tax=Spirodela intermedia TaxID=51605 RepID=A0A7I8IYR0_SPIIN|nr:unnamed protein product [Spirodela intermedia]CAA6663027.1 unnamed protein product [Spirodela intermedia]